MIKAKKSLGQNFLTDRKILEQITSVIPIEGKTILEVGPGTGNLTSFILKNNPKKVIVVEKDINLSEKGVLVPPNPVAVPLLAIVAPDGIVIVSPELPISKEVPDCGSNLSTNKVPIILPSMFLLLSLFQCN